jgi:hypothetical protein
MLIKDLSHLEIVDQASGISGSSDSLLLSIQDTALILQLGSETLFQTTLPSAPTGIAVSVSGVPGVAVSSSTQNINGVTESLVIVNPAGATVSNGLITLTGISSVPGI